MKKWAKYISSLCLLTETALARQLVVSTPDWPPFYVHDSNIPTRRGIAWDILTQCSNSLNHAVKFDMYPIKRMFKYMEKGELDINIMSFKADRTKHVEYGKEVIFENTYSIWVHKNETQMIRSLQDLNSFSMAQLIGLRPSDDFNKWYDSKMNAKIPNESHVVNSLEQVLKMLANQRIQATAASSPETRWRANRLGLLPSIKDSGLTLQKQPYFFVVAKESPFYKQDPNILQKMDQCLRQMKRNGQWSELKKYYNL